MPTEPHAADAPTWPARPPSAADPSAPPTPRVGTAPTPQPPELPGYEVLRELGRGSSGVVYLARHRPLNRLVALKVLRAVRGDTEGPARFRVEAESSARLRHPNVVHVYEVGEAGDCMFLSMEYVAGGTLAHRLAAGPLTPHESADLIGRLALAVHHAHDHGIVHRDIKPANILLRRGQGVSRGQGTGDRGQGSEDQERREEGKNGGEQRDVAQTGNPPFPSCLTPDPDSLSPDPDPLTPGPYPLTPAQTPALADFGLAKRAGTGDRLTVTGAVLGTPAYMSPEQATGDVRRVGAAADVYSLGAVLYECLTGRPPFQAPTAAEALIRVITEEPIPVRGLAPGVPRDLETVCLKCLEKDPTRRYATAAALADDLGRFLGGLPVRARPLGATGRAWRWCRRNPAVAALLLALAFTLAGGTIASGVFAALARHEAHEARTSEGRAVESARRLREADRLLRRHLYAAQVGLAETAWRDSDPARTAELLDGWGPATDANAPRGVEWFHLSRIARPERAVYPGLPESVAAATFSPDGNRVFAVCWDGTLRAWERTDGRVVWSTHMPRRNLLSVTLPSDGRTVAAAGDGGVWLHDAADGSLLRTLPCHGGNAWSAAFDATGHLLVTGGFDRKVALWDVETGELLADLTGHEQPVKSVAVSADGSRIVSGDLGGSVRIWDAAARRQLWALDAHSGIVGGVALTPDGKTAASSGADGLVRLWDAERGRERRAWAGAARSYGGVALSRDGRRVLAAGGDGSVRVWEDEHEVLILKGHTAPAHTVALSPDGREAVTASEDRSVRIWSTDPYQFAREPLPGRPGSHGIALSADGRRAVTSGSDRAIRLWDVSTGRRLAEWPSAVVALAVALSADGSQVAAGFTDGSSRLLRDDGTSTDLSGRSRGTPAVAVSGGTVVTAGGDGLRLWDANTGKLRYELAGKEGRVAAVAIWPDGGRVLSASEDGSLRVWDTATGAEVRRWSSPGILRCADLSPDGSRVAVGGADGAVRLWDAESGAPLGELRGHRQGARRVTLSAGASRVAVLAGNDTLALWDGLTGQPLPAIRSGERGLGLAITPDGRTLWTAHPGGAIRTWGEAGP